MAGNGESFDLMDAQAARLRLIDENHQAWKKVNKLQAMLDYIENDSSEGYRLVQKAKDVVEDELST